MPPRSPPALERWQPWAVVNTAGFVRVDDAERDPRQWRDNLVGPGMLAQECAQRGIRLMSFSSDLVFDGSKDTPYVESDSPAPLNAYGRAKFEAERLVLDHAPDALLIRTSAFFGPWDPHNFVAQALEHLRRGEHWAAAEDQCVSPTYVPDLAQAALDLLVDGESGLWHLSNQGEVSWYRFAQMAAEAANVDARLIRGLPTSALGQLARRPGYSVLTSERALLMPSLEHALVALRDGLRTLCGRLAAAPRSLSGEASQPRPVSASSGGTRTRPRCPSRWYWASTPAGTAARRSASHSATQAPPKPAPVNLAPNTAGCGLQQRHQSVELRRRHLVIVAQAGMRSVHQRAERRGRGAGHCLEHAGVLGHHMAGSALQQVGQGRQPVHPGDVAQRRHAQQASGFLALGAALVVAAGGERPRDARIEHQHGAAGRQFHEAPLQRSRVQQQRAPRCPPGSRPSGP